MSRNDEHESRCQRLGDLAAAALPEAPVAREQWAELQIALGHRPRRRRWLLLAPVCALMLVGVQSLRTLHMDVQGCDRVANNDGDEWRVPAQGHGSFAFDDGTHIGLGAGSRSQVETHGFRRGAHLDLRDGHMDLDVIHRWSGRWEVTAGPFHVRVTGTRFSVDWSAAVGRFSVAVREGEVRVTGGPLSDERRVRAGERLDVDMGEKTAPRTITPQAQSPLVPLPSVAPTTTGAPQTTHAWTSKPAHARQGRSVAVHQPKTRPVLRPVELPETPATLPGLVVSPPEKPAPELPPPASISAASDEPSPRKPRRTVQGPQGPIWVGAARRTIFTEQSTSPDHAYVENGLFCTRGILPALICTNANEPNVQCDWSDNWGVLIGWTPTSELVRTAASSLSFEYRGRTGVYRLTAHRRGEPANRVYCIDRYRSGRVVEPADFQLSCWESGGRHLSDFSDVDSFALQIISRETTTPFRFCLSNITLE
jgi:hypothetical protein